MSVREVGRRDTERDRDTETNADGETERDKEEWSCWRVRDWAGPGLACPGGTALPSKLERPESQAPGGGASRGTGGVEARECRSR